MEDERDWANLLNKSRDYWHKATTNKREAGRYLWLGALSVIESWVPDADPTGEVLYRAVLWELGGTRKGSASKIKTVALATVHYSLQPSAYGSLNAAYQAAQRLALGSATDLDPVPCTCNCHGTH